MDGGGSGTAGAETKALGAGVAEDEEAGPDAGLGASDDGAATGASSASLGAVAGATAACAGSGSTTGDGAGAGGMVEWWRSSSRILLSAR